MRTKLLMLCVLLAVSHLQAKEPQKPLDSTQWIQEQSQLFYAVSNAQKPANWFSDAWDWLSQAWKPVHGIYSEGGSTNRGTPLASADRQIEIQTLRSLLTNKIKAGSDFDPIIKEIYIKIYDNANAALGSHTDKGVCVNASIAKDAAFVYWLGIDETGANLSAAARNVYLVKIKSIMWAWADDKVVSFAGKGTQISRAKENIMLMQAYSFLEMAKLENAGLFPDDAREDLRMEIFKFTYELYSRSNNWASGGEGGALTPFIKNNMTLIVSAAVGMGSVILSERGTYFWANQRKPDRWANAAHAYIQDVLWDDSKAVADASKGTGGGFAEGPYYFKFTFEALLPFFQSFKNFTNGSQRGFGPYYKCTFCFGEYKLSENYYKHSNYLGLYNWYKNIQMPNGDAPTIDDSWSVNNHFGGLALSGESEHSLVADPSFTLINPHMNLRADYLARYNFYDGSGSDVPQNYHNKESGDMIVRTPSDLPFQEQHYLHLNIERGKALNGGSPLVFPSFLGLTPDFPFGHEHADIGNIIIAAGEDVLAMDPAYYGDKGLDNHKVNKGHHHNVITIDGEGPDVEDDAQWSALISNDEFKLMRFKAQYWNYPLSFRTSRKATVERNIEVHGLENKMRYYVIDDYVTNRNWSDNQTIAFNLNGNGNQLEGSYYTINNNTAVWNYPCLKDGNNTDNWRMQATLTAYKSGQTMNNTISSQNGSSHGNFSGAFNSILSNNTYTVGNEANINRPKTSNGNMYGEHTRMTKQIDVSPDEVVHFKTTIQILQCNAIDTMPPQLVSNTRYNSHLLKFDHLDSLRNFHLSRIGAFPTVDTVTNPLDLDSNIVLESNAQNVYISYSKNSEKKFGWCTSYTHFRAMKMEHGDTLIYNDTNYILASRKSDVFYKLIGRYRYQGYVNSDSGATVGFFLPDLAIGIPMKIASTNGKQISGLKYDTSTFKLRAQFTEGYTEFVIELVDPCLFTCFFPPTQVNIVDTFDFNTGSIERLGHDLDIVPDSGWLNMTNGSKVSICAGIVLTNRDSITMLGQEGGNGSVDPVRPPVSAANQSGEGNNSNAGTKSVINNGMTQDMPNSSKRCMIIINDLAALVLDSGSRTYIGANSTILVKKGGTLFVKKGAMVEIGSKHYQNRDDCFGEILAEDSAFVCIEDSSDLHFFKNANDSADKNRFFVTTIDSFPSKAEVNINGIKGKFNALDIYDNPGRFSSHNCIPFCDLKLAMPPDGINNRHFGWSNISRPYVYFDVNDTFCVGDSGYIYNADKSLNESDFTITVRRIQIVGPDTFTLRKASFTRVTDEIKRLRPTEQFMPYYQFDSAGLHAVKVEVWNTCGEVAVLEKTFHVRAKPTPIIVMGQDTVCPGIGSVSVMDSTIDIYPRYSTKWHAHMIEEAPSPNILRQTYGGDWEFAGRQYNFSFPDFNWLGGFRYALSLTVTNECGATTAWDTVTINPGAYIQLSNPRVYGTNISGFTSVQLTAHTPMADSFTWSPTTWLNRSDSSVVISTPQDSIDYILTAYKGTCVAHDTAHIKYNIYANAGVNDTLCFDSTHTPEVLLGFPYDMSLFVGMLYYFDREEPGSSTVCTQNFMSTYQTHNSSNATDYFKYFTHFMHTAAFANAVPTLYDQFVNDLDKNLFFKHANYKNYYKNFTAFNDPYMSMLNGFVSWIDNNATLKTEMSRLNAWCGIYSNLDQLLTDYDYFVANNTADISASWSKIVGNDTTALTSYNNLFVAVDNPTKTSKYLLTTITPTKAEIDEITIIVDTLLSTAFSPALQFDSTVYFQSFVEPYSKALSYHWNFGDGTSSTEKHPIHTFPAFDSNYVVCLTVTNTCSSFSFCDTVRIDSAHLGGGLAIRKNIPFYESDGKQSSITNKQKSANSYQPTATNQQLSLSNYPNPFDNNTIIAYEIWQNFEQAELKITNVLGQAVFVKKLDRPIDKIEINGQVLPNGIYYYSIVLDGAVKQTKSMSVIH